MRIRICKYIFLSKKIRSGLFVYTCFGKSDIGDYFRVDKDIGTDLIKYLRTCKKGKALGQAIDKSTFVCF